MGLRLSDEAVSVLIEALEQNLKKAEENASNFFDDSYLLSNFIATSPDMIIACANYICTQLKGDEDKIRKTALMYFHETEMDMSTIPCCKGIFKSWDEED